MYLEHFGLRELPFRLSPDPSFLYLSEVHARAKAYMESTIWFTDGFVVITGEIGSGKTTLIETFLKEIDRDVVVAQVNQTQVSPTEFLQSLLVQFGFTPFKMKKAELLATINSFLIEQYAAGRKVLLIVDEAQNLSNKVLEEVRLLSGVETTKEKVLRIILAGQPELNDKLDSPELVQLKQRIRLRFHLTALSEPEMINYVQHRLAVAGSQGRALFQPETFQFIYRYTNGIPRLTNTLCDTALLAAFAQDSVTVGLPELQAAVAELQWVEYAARGEQSEEQREALDATAPQPVPVGRLVLSQRGTVITEAVLGPGRFVIGRTEENDLRIDSKIVSRHHAQVTTNLEGSIIEDLNSTNGTYLRGKRIRRHRFVDGDVVKIGVYELTYHRVAEADAYEDEDGASTTAAPEPSDPADDAPVAQFAGEG